MRACLVHLAKRDEGKTPIIVVERHGIIICDRLADEIDCALMLTALIGEYAEEMEAVSVARIARQNLAIEPLGLRELPGLMEAQCLGEAVPRAVPDLLGKAPLIPAHIGRPLAQ